MQPRLLSRVVCLLPYRVTFHPRVVLVTGCTGVFDRSANKEQKSEIRFFIASLYSLPSTIRFTQRVDRVSIGLFYNALWRIVCSKTIIEQIAFVTGVVSFWQRWRAWRWIDCHVRHCPKLIVGERVFLLHPRVTVKQKGRAVRSVRTVGHVLCNVWYDGFMLHAVMSDAFYE